MAMEKEGQSEQAQGYPKRIQTKDGSIRTVNSPEEEAQIHQEEREQN